MQHTLFQACHKHQILSGGQTPCPGIRRRPKNSDVMRSTQSLLYFHVKEWTYVHLEIEKYTIYLSWFFSIINIITEIETCTDNNMICLQFTLFTPLNRLGGLFFHRCLIFFFSQANCYKCIVSAYNIKNSNPIPSITP